MVVYQPILHVPETTTPLWMTNLEHILMTISEQLAIRPYYMKRLSKERDLTTFPSSMEELLRLALY